MQLPVPSFFRNIANEIDSFEAPWSNKNESIDVYGTRCHSVPEYGSVWFQGCGNGMQAASPKLQYVIEYIQVYLVGADMNASYHRL